MILKFTKWLEKKISNYRFLTDTYNLYYKSTVNSEIQAAEINENNRILCIGGGAVPSTALILAKKTRAKIDIIDIDIEAIEKSRKLIEIIGLDKQIKIKQADGTKIDVSNYDVIHIASQACPKDKILKNITKKARCGTKILVRQPQSFLKKFYSQYTNSSIENCRLKNTTGSNKFKFNTMKSTLVLVKN